ncbi:MAG: glycosyltransferase family 2 protein [Candidatus Omnitrophica bacterium]|nr:glycosyltransferase family 2 protein [Candidatus Omnitrophota bacterium]
MLNGKKIIVVMPAYNAAKTLQQTYEEIPREVVDEVILVDDSSRDETVAVARRLGIRHVVHRENLGYGANQKTCYRLALEIGADIVIMLHPDYQYPPQLITPMAGMIVSGLYHVVIGSRVLGRGALAGGMPRYKYVANRVLTLIQNLCLGRKLTEYHSGYRAFSREVLLRLPLGENHDDFVFDNQMLLQLIYFGYEVAEITCPSRYFEGASSISMRRATVYGCRVLWTTAQYLIARAGLGRPRIFRRDGRRLFDAHADHVADAGGVGELPLPALRD